FALSVVAPCVPFGVNLLKSSPSFTFVSVEYAQVLFPATKYSHQMPMYFVGLIHDTSESLLGSLRFRIVLDVRISPALSLTRIVRRGVVARVCMYPLLPTASGVR